MSASGFGPGFGRAGAGSGRERPGGGGWPGGVRYEQVNVDDIGDLFGGLFGGAARRRPPAGRAAGRGPRDRRSISFEDAVAGTTVPIKIDGPAVCSRCHGSGAELGPSRLTCPQCGGSGEIAENQGFFSMSRPCPRCGGAGRIVESPCTKCGGSGAERRTRTLHVKIPAGVRNGARIRLAGKGEPGPAGGRPGDLYVKVAVDRTPCSAGRETT